LDFWPAVSAAKNSVPRGKVSSDTSRLAVRKFGIRKGMQLVFDFLEALRTTRAYPKKGNLIGFQEAD
jgi:hypothetical protein